MSAFLVYCLALLLPAQQPAKTYARPELLIEASELAKPEVAGKFRILDIRSPAHFRPPFVFVLGRNSTTSSQSTAAAMRRSVSIRGGPPPRSKRAIADCVVPQSSASSCCERSRARRYATTCSAIRAKNQPSSGSPATRSRRSASRRRRAVSFRRGIASEL